MNLPDQPRESGCCYCNDVVSRRKINRSFPIAAGRRINYGFAVWAVDLNSSTGNDGAGLIRNFDCDVDWLIRLSLESYGNYDRGDGGGNSEAIIQTTLHTPPDLG